MKISNKLLKKIICALLLLVCISSILISTVNAAAFETDENNFKGVDSKVNTLTENSAKTAVTIIRIAGVTIAIVMLLAIAIKYMVSSAGDRADIKKHAVAYVVGAFILFGAVGIIGMLNEFAVNISKD